jgi:hypothetical protein
VALLKPLRGDVSQDGQRLPEPGVAGSAWREQRGRRPVSAPRRLILETFMPSLEAPRAAEQRLTARRLAIEDPRGALLERPPAMGPLAARGWMRALDPASRVEDQQAAAHDGALAPTSSQSGTVRHLGRLHREGRPEGRRVWWLCAQTVVRMKAHGAKPLPQVCARVLRRRGKPRARVALAWNLRTTADGVLKWGQPAAPRARRPAPASRTTDSRARVSHPDGQPRTVSPPGP